jgi:hypothetical protein
MTPPKEQPCLGEDDGVRCTRSGKEKGGARGLCQMHYARLHRPGRHGKAAKRLGPAVQLVFKAPREHAEHLAKLALTRAVEASDLLREALSEFLSRANNR